MHIHEHAHSATHVCTFVPPSHSPNVNVSLLAELLHLSLPPSYHHDADFIVRLLLSAALAVSRRLGAAAGAAV